MELHDLAGLTQIRPRDSDGDSTVRPLKSDEPAHRDHGERRGRRGGTK